MSRRGHFAEVHGVILWRLPPGKRARRSAPDAAATGAYMEMCRLTVSASRPAAGQLCWSAFGGGVRQVLLRRLAPGGVCLVSKRGRLEAWQKREIVADLADLFVTQEAAFAWYRLLRDQRRRIASLGAAA
jgi:hypothetical protein